MPTWQQRLIKARETAEVRAREAATMAEEATTKGRAAIDRRRADRRAAAEQRERWFLDVSEDIHSEGYADEEAMRRGIEASAAHGWTAANITEVHKRRLPGGVSTLLAREAVDRLRQSPRYLVTFKRDPRDAPPPPPPTEEQPPPEDPP